MDDYKKMATMLSYLVDAIGKNENLDNYLNDMRELAKKIGGKVLEKYNILEEDIKKNGNKEEIAKQCLKLKNELWEL